MTEPVDPVEPVDPGPRLVTEPVDPGPSLAGGVTEPADPVDHPDCDPDVSWTSGNVAEAFPGVCTPLGFSFMHAPVELALRSAFRDIGVFTDAQVRVPARVEQQFWSVFAGRAAANMDQFRALADLTPGTSATAVEQQLFGYVRPGTVDRNSYRRYPAIAVKAPGVVARLGARHDARFAELRTWRTATLRGVPELDRAGCLRVIGDAQRQFQEIMRLHFLATFVGNGVVDKLTELAARHGGPGLAARLLSGVGSDENEVAADLWELAHGRLEQTEFLDRHGYHGPSEGQLDSVSWRENPELLAARLADYRAMGDSSPRAPRPRSAAQRGERVGASGELAAALPALRRPSARLLVRLAGRYLALREQGKAGYLITFDVARAAARRLGGQLVGAGVLSEVGDVFFLTDAELRSADPGPAAALVPARRAVYLERQGQRLPDAWCGVPEPIAVAAPGAGGPAAPAGTTLTGVGACGGVVEGRARVVADPEKTELDEGDLLVCEATDPSWISLFVVASGVVTDLGGMLSHGAIVARELGIPCVVGTRTGSRQIRDGQRIRVDGARGVVELLD
ncbi:MAG: rifampicin phosphotransferase [Pseudonocardiales bacterium]|nr:rifampicin phosphotransferase [Pseudonocardiales bacterium]